MSRIISAAAVGMAVFAAASCAAPASAKVPAAGSAITGARAAALATVDISAAGPRSDETICAELQSRLDATGFTAAMMLIAADADPDAWAADYGAAVSAYDQLPDLDLDGASAELEAAVKHFDVALATLLGGGMDVDDQAAAAAVFKAPGAAYAQIRAHCAAAGGGWAIR